MLGKAATHFRPLLRVQSSHAQPDLFTSNPSLLHHFQGSQGLGGQLVAQSSAQAASGSSGAAGGAGRAGQGAFNGGGYTGHARAFLSIPQGSTVDPSQATSAEDHKEKDARHRAGARLAFKQRQAIAREKPTRVVSVRDQLGERSGSRNVQVREIEAAPREADQAGPKRSSIAYPAWAALPADTAHTGALWLPGSAPARPLGARNFSTRTRTRHTPQIKAADEPLVSSVPNAESRQLDQPNRVLMDLAGLDLAARPVRQQVRRNSTHSVVRPEVPSSDDVAGLAAVDAAVSPDQADLNIYLALSKADRQGDGEYVRALVEHYRTPRSAGAPLPAPADARLAKFPLPAGYTTQTYNACLDAVLARRARGESIAPVLDMYNEMLARDIVPNMRTYSLVIRALCLREEDVAAASRRWKHDRDWVAFKKERLGIELAETEADQNAAEAIAAYQSEMNLASALKLYNVAKTFYPRHIAKELSVHGDLVSASASAVGLNLGTTPADVLPIVKEALATDLDLDLYTAIFEVLGAAGKDELATLRSAWAKFEAASTAACNAATKPGASQKDADAAAQARNAALNIDRDATCAAVQAFVAAGEAATATSIVESRLNSPDHKVRQSRNLEGALVTALAKAGDLDGALKWYGSRSLSILTPADTYNLADSLTAAGRSLETVSLLRGLNDKVAIEMSGIRVDRARAMIVYGRIIAEAVAADDADIAQKLLDAAAELVTNVGTRLDTAVLRIHVERLVAAGQFNAISRILNAFPARQASEPDVDLRAALTAVVSAEEAPIVNVLEVIRGMARLGESITAPSDKLPIAKLVVDKYMAARAKVDNVADLHLSQDAWFRLLEAVVSAPSVDIESGAVDGAIEQLLGDLVPTGKGRFALAFTTSPAVADLADILVSRFSIDRATELLTSAFGEKAAALLPTPEGSFSSSPEAGFMLPPTPESGDVPPATLQPPSAHTLHFSPELVAMIDKISYPGAPDPERVYATVRNALTKENAVPTPEALGRLIAALAGAGDEPKARELYSLAQVVLASCMPDTRSQAEGWRAVEDAMIAACCFLGHLEQAGMHRHRIIEAGMAPSADAYATMIASSRDSTDDALVARELWDESQALGVVPHLYLFNTIISKLSKARKAEMALELFGHMKAAGIRPSSVTYGAVINACCRVGDAESAAVLFDEMSSQPNFKPRVPPFNTMMQFHLQTRPSRERVLYYYDAMRKAGVRPSAHTYKLLLDAYGTLTPADLSAMERVFGDLCADRTVPVQGTHWASLITAYGIHNSDVAKATSVFDSIATHPSTQAKKAPEPVVWEAVLNVLGQNGTLEQLEAMRARMDSAPTRPTAYVCNVLISGYSRHGALDRAREVFESMADSLMGVAAPNNHPALLTSSGHVKPTTASASDASAGVYREPSTYEAMIRAELRAGNRAEAEAVLKRMEERRYPVAVWMKARAILDE